jgi:hypothetical protein
VVGLTLLTLGVASVQVTTAYSLQFLALGCLLQAVGWTVLPSAGWRRVMAFVPAILASCLLLGGGGYAGSFAIILAGWLLVRHRPLATFTLMIAPILLGAAVSGVLVDGIEIDYNSGWIVLAVGGGITSGCAWAARAWAVATARRRRPGSGQPDAGANAAESAAGAASDAHGTISRETGDLR